jgi:hypothetical protein
MNPLNRLARIALMDGVQLWRAVQTFCFDERMPIPCILSMYIFSDYAAIG